MKHLLITRWRKRRLDILTNNSDQHSNTPRRAIGLKATTSTATKVKRQVDLVTTVHSSVPSATTGPKVEVESYGYTSGTLSGVIWVQNIAYVKIVQVIYSTTGSNWNNNLNVINATYQASQSNGYETWIFSASVSSVDEFYVKYVVNGTTYYDNNDTNNYVVTSSTTSTTTQTTSTTSSSTATSTPPTILFQAFDWDSSSTASFYQSLQANISKIAAAGANYAWLPPPADSGATQGYLPRRLNVFNSSYGLETDLRSVVTALRNAGIGPVYDAVFNHRVGYTGWCDFQDSYWPSTYITSDDEACNTASVVCTNTAITPSSTGCGPNKDTGEGFAGGRDLDFLNPTVLNDYRNYLCQLRADLSSGGFQFPYVGARFDFVLGYAQTYFNEFVDPAQQETWCNANTAYTYNTIDSSKAIDSFCVAENWISGSLDSCSTLSISSSAAALGTWVSNTTCHAFDFVTKYALTCAINNNNFAFLNSTTGSLPGIIGTHPLQTVTMVDNHDTGDSGGLWSGQRIMAFADISPDATTYITWLTQAYVYIMTHPGTPSIYSPHLLNSAFGSLNTVIPTLSALRSSLGIQNNANVAICKAESVNDVNLYAAYVKPISTGSWSVAMMIGNGTWCPLFNTGSCTGTLVAGGASKGFSIWSYPSGIANPPC
ncbi:hypothetical protein HK100_010978 [Physocladia obscura]|uniref:CBM21 domain-containing protein n=1 Tax=Physocladia obscura TaxID=109957 RepID=A0AAD5TBH2_9FUNG|nr:hypothetical protein HK100_010978 [Physocladia obscura]